MDEINWTPIIIGVCIIIAALIIAFSMQFEIVSLETQQAAFVYKLNKMTGKTWLFCIDTRNRWWEEIPTIKTFNKDIELPDESNP